MNLRDLGVGSEGVVEVDGFLGTQIFFLRIEYTHTVDSVEARKSCGAQ